VAIWTSSTIHIGRCFSQSRLTSWQAEHTGPSKTDTAYLFDEDISQPIASIRCSPGLTCGVSGVRSRALAFSIAKSIGLINIEQFRHDSLQ
jgi:hypothetical protein